MKTSKSSTNPKPPIFAYLRRSTSKEEQAESLIQQEDGIGSIVKKLWFEKEDIVYFAETYSGFENKKRKKWGELIKAIDSLKTPCIILARDISRLSRNPTDSQWIQDRLYGDNKKKRLIEKIYTLDYDNIKEWDRTTDKEDVHKALSAGYYDSLDTRRKSIGGILLKLEDRQFPYAAPKGLDNFKEWNRRILKQNDRMPIVRRAFEMKTEGKSHKEIARYLRGYEIRIGERDLTDRFFRNPIYIGEYQEKTTGKHFSKLDFFEGHPPISRALWDKVQQCLGRKMSQYWEKQDGHLFEAKIRSESGHVFSKYVAKKVYPAYKGKFKDESGNEEFIHISEKQILESFVKTISGILESYSQKFLKRFKDEVLELSLEAVIEEKGMKEPGSLYKDFLSLVEGGGNSEPMEWAEEFAKRVVETAKDFSLKLYLLRMGAKQFVAEGFSSWEEVLAYVKKRHASAKRKGEDEGLNEELFGKKILMEKGLEALGAGAGELPKDLWYGFEAMSLLTKEWRKAKDGVSKSVASSKIAETLEKAFAEKNKEFEIAKTGQIGALKKRKEELEQEKKNYRREALKMGYSKEEIDATTKDMEHEILVLEEKIGECAWDDEMEQYLKKLPKVLLETVELASNGLRSEEIEGMRDRLKILLEITTVELTVSNKKELKVKLFDVLDRLISSDMSTLEALSLERSNYLPLRKLVETMVKNHGFAKSLMARI